MIILVAVVGLACLVGLGIYLRCFAGWNIWHQRLLGGLTLLFLCWVAMLPGAGLRIILPGGMSVVLGAGAGAVVAGLLSASMLGTIGVVTGGVGIAIGWMGMAVIGGVLGAIGGAAGISIVRVPLINPYLLAPFALVGLYWLLGFRRQKRLRADT